MACFSICVVVLILMISSVIHATKNVSLSKKTTRHYWKVANGSTTKIILPNLQTKVAIVDDADDGYYQSQAFHNWLTKTMRDYDRRLRPDFGGKTLKIDLDLNLISISSVNAANMEVTLEMFFHESWTDERLKYDAKQLGVNLLTLPLDAPYILWVPDTTFLNAKRSINPEQGSVSHLYYMKLYDNCTMQYSRRLSITTECRMDLTMYPFDQQACRMQLSSYGLTVEDIIYVWALQTNSIPIERINLPDFYITHYTVRVVNLTFVAGVYSVPEICIGLKRRSGFCFVQVFVPATSVVASSWISLWLENETHFADIVSIIAAIIFLSYSYNSVMPKVSYVKAVDIYLGACFMFAFLSLVKLAIMKYMHKRLHRRKEKAQAATLPLLSLLRSVNEQLPLLAASGPLASASDCEDSQYSTDRSSASGGRRSTLSFNLNKPAQRNSGDSEFDEEMEGFSESYHDNYWRCMKTFHVACQLILPLAFAAFGIFYFILYPSLQARQGLCT